MNDYASAGSYGAFVNAKSQSHGGHGFEPTHIPEHLFPFQRELVEWSVRQGRAAIFADCGMGKTPMELAWAQNVHEHTGKPVLLLTPLAVGYQVVAEAQKFGHEAAQSRNGKPSAPITVTNYEQAAKFDPADFGGVVCDESSAIKAFEGSTRAIVTELMRKMPYRLLGTATAAPNDYLELGTSSEALGELGYMDMLGRFFKSESGTSTHRPMGGKGKSSASKATAGQYRFKGHAQEPFWRWVSSWARAIRKPSDYGYDDGEFILPALLERSHLVESVAPKEGTLFDTPAFGLREEREEARRTLNERCEQAAALLEDAGAGVAWCHLNDESSRLATLIEGGVELTGSASADEKEEKLLAFSRGDIRVLVTKPVIGAWGLNWQHAHRMTYFPSHSYEQYYQSVRRMWRFGQRHEVVVDVVTTEGGLNVLKNLRRKSKAADAMFTALIAHMNEALTLQRRLDYEDVIQVPAWLT